LSLTAHNYPKSPSNRNFVAPRAPIPDFCPQCHQKSLTVGCLSPALSGVLNLSRIKAENGYFTFGFFRRKAIKTAWGSLVSTSKRPKLLTSLLTESSGAYGALYKLNRCAE
jgi:hypothetical protein